MGAVVGIAIAYHKFTEETPLTNLYVSLLQKLGVETERFADSTGAISELG